MMNEKMSSDTPPHDWETSQSLLARARRKDATAWQRIVHIYGPLVVHWCRKSAVLPGEIDDVAQDIFLSVYRRLTDFRKDRPGDTFRGWLRTITRRRIADHFRRRSRRLSAEGGSHFWQRISSIPDPDAILVGDEEAESEEAEVASRALELIRNDFQENTWSAFWQTTVEGRTSAEAAGSLSMSQAAVRMARSRVIARLRQELDGLIESRLL